MEGIGRGKLMQLHKQQIKKLKDHFKNLKSKAKGAERKKVEADFIIQEKEMIQRHQQELSKFEGIEDSLTEEIQPEAKKPPGISKAQKKRLKKEEEERAKDIERENCVNETRDLENERISSLLESLGLSIFPVISNQIASDGNCLFRALSHQLLHKTSQNLPHTSIRSEIVSYISSHAADFLPFLLDGESIESHCTKMQQLGEWGGHMEIVAFTELYRCPIKIVTASGVIEVGSGESWGTITHHKHYLALGEHFNSSEVRSCA
jgi:OTU domain-containing protein 6